MDVLRQVASTRFDVDVENDQQSSPVKKSKRITDRKQKHVTLNGKLVQVIDAKEHPVKLVNKVSLRDQLLARCSADKRRPLQRQGVFKSVT